MGRQWGAHRSGEGKGKEE
jgi:hypothetical protein